MSDSIRERQQAERGLSGATIPGNPKISMVVACYKNPHRILLPLASFIAQTYQNWECLVVHDGPGGEAIEARVRSLKDDRIEVHQLIQNASDWGNSCKEFGSLISLGDYVGHSNDDNFYAPVYFEWMLRSIIDNHAQFAYCNMVHSHRQYQPMTCEPKVCHIDGGGWLCEGEIVRNTPWPEPKSDSHADGYYVEALTSQCGRVTHVPSYLFTHN